MTISGPRATSRLVRAVLASLALAAGGCLQTVVLNHNASTSSGDLDAGNNIDTGWNPGANCPGNPFPRLTFSQALPDVLIASDRSMPVGAHFGQGSWFATEDQLLSQQVTTYQYGIAFGYEESPVTAANCSFGAPGCCAGKIAPPTPGQGAIQHANDCAMAPGGCLVSVVIPTVSALSQALQFYGGFDNDRSTDRYVLLITNGDPTCTSDGLSDPCSEATSAIASLQKAGVKTIVVGVGDGVDGATCLGTMALEGGAERMNPPYYYAARDPDALTSVLTEILGNLSGSACHIELRSPATDPNDVALSLGGVLIPRDPTDADGWNFNPGSQLKITVYGAWCTMLQNSFNQLEIIGCPNGQH